MAKNTDAPNRQFNVESERMSVHDDYLTCLKILAIYSRRHEDSIIAYAIWGGRKRLGLKFQGRNVTIGVVKGGDIEVGVTHEIVSPFELRKYLENTMQFYASKFKRGNLRKSLRAVKED